ncbi:hypothetical protein GS507_26575 [Rhodococcus hoagii]|nr:hypothetical protein [Prescottella equi]
MSQKTFRLPTSRGPDRVRDRDVARGRGRRGEREPVLADVETAKAVVEVSSPFAGVVAALHGARVIPSRSVRPW